MKPEELATRLAGALPTELRCVVLYGSAAAGDFVPGASNYNVFVIAERWNVTELDAVRSVVSNWCAAGNPPPLLFTAEQLAASTDAFPIELLDIRQSRCVLWGEDLLANMRVEADHLRRQVERELTGKLLKLRGQYVLALDRPGGVLELMLSSLSTFLVLFRAALRLFEEKVPERKLDALHALAKHITFEVRPFERLFELKQLPAGKVSAAPSVTFAEYLAAIEQVAGAINGGTIPQRSQA